MAITSSSSRQDRQIVDHSYERGSTEVSLAEFVNAEREGKGWHGEYILLDLDREARAIRCYRATGEPGERECVKVVLENVRISLHPTTGRDPDKFDLHDMEANTFLTWLDCMKWERSDLRVRLDWYQECGRPMMDGKDVHSEMLALSYRTERGKERSVTIEKPWISGLFPDLMAGF